MQRLFSQPFRAVGLIAGALLLLAQASGPVQGQGLTPPTVADTPSPATSVPPWSATVVDSDDLAAVLNRTATTLAVSVPTTKPRAKAKAKAKAKAAVPPTTTIAVVLLAAGSLPVGSPSSAQLPATPVTSASPDDPAIWAALRKCESGNRYDLNTGNGYYGAYQFALGTWQRLGYPGYPHQATPAIQDEAAKKLQAKQGWGPWPSCSRRIGAR